MEEEWPPCVLMVAAAEDGGGASWHRNAGTPPTYAYTTPASGAETPCPPRHFYANNRIFTKTGSGQPY